MGALVHNGIEADFLFGYCMLSQKQLRVDKENHCQWILVSAISTWNEAEEENSAVMSVTDIVEPFYQI